EAERAGLEAVGDLAEGLGGAGGVVAGQAVREAGEGDPALGLDLVTGIAGAAAQAERAPLRAAVEAEVPVPAGAGGGAPLGLEGGAAVADGKAGAPVLAERGVEAGQEAAGRPGQRRGVAVAVELAPGAEAARPGGRGQGVGRGRRPPGAVLVVGQHR